MTCKHRNAKRISAPNAQDDFISLWECLDCKKTFEDRN